VPLFIQRKSLVRDREKHSISINIIPTNTSRKRFRESHTPWSVVEIPWCLFTYVARILCAGVLILMYDPSIQPSTDGKPANCYQAMWSSYTWALQSEIAICFIRLFTSSKASAHDNLSASLCGNLIISLAIEHINSITRSAQRKYVDSAMLKRLETVLITLLFPANLMDVLIIEITSHCMFKCWNNYHKNDKTCSSGVIFSFPPRYFSCGKNLLSPNCWINLFATGRVTLKFFLNCDV
jgi:hypothetical protein